MKVQITKTSFGFYQADVVIKSHDGVELRRSLKNITGSPCLSEAQAVKIANTMKQNDYIIEWVNV